MPGLLHSVLYWQKMLESFLFIISDLQAQRNAILNMRTNSHGARLCCVIRTYKASTLSSSAGRRHRPYSLVCRIGFCTRVERDCLIYLHPDMERLLHFLLGQNTKETPRRHVLTCKVVHMIFQL